MENAWMINEPKKKRKGKSKRRGVKKDMAKKAKKKARRNTPKKKRTYRRNEPESRKKKRYRRNEPRKIKRYRRNEPDPAVMDIVYAAVGFVGTKFAGNMIAPAIGITSPIARIAVKSGLAFVGGKFVVGKFVGRKAGEMFLIGGLVEVVSDVVKTFVAPSVPALAAYEEPLQIESIGAYEELDAYPELEGVEEEAYE